MFTSPVSRVTRLSAGAWLRRILAALATAAAGVLAWGAAVPAASAATILIPDPGAARHTGQFRPPRSGSSQPAACRAGRSLSSRSPLPWSRPPPPCS